MFASFEGGSPSVVRHAKLRGLVVIVRGESEDAVRLDVSGPYSLFRHTLLYGRALGELVPFLAWTARYRLEAACAWAGNDARLRLESGAPIFPSSEPRPYDSKVEERFARDFRRGGAGRDLVREPRAIRAGGTAGLPGFRVPTSFGLTGGCRPGRSCPSSIGFQASLVRFRRAPYEGARETGRGWRPTVCG